MRRVLILLAILAVAAGQAYPQEKTGTKKQSDEERLEWWHEARFGMFIHWGVYALYGGKRKDDPLPDGFRLARRWQIDCSQSEK